MRMPFGFRVFLLLTLLLFIKTVRFDNRIATCKLVNNRKSLHVKTLTKTAPLRLINVITFTHATTNRKYWDNPKS